MKKILVATDFSDSCRNALEYAVEMIKSTDIQIDLLHTFDIPVVVTTSIPTRAIHGMMVERAKAVEGHLLEWQEWIPVRQRGIIKAIYGPFPATEIAEFARESAHDMIVMGLRAKYGLMDRMMGSVTAQTIQLATVPVLAVPDKSRFSGLSRILFPTAMTDVEDLPKEEMAAIDWLTRFAAVFGAPTIKMIHIESNGTPSDVEITFKHQVRNEIDFIRGYAENIEQGILDHYESEGADLIAFYRPHRYFWERLYHSSLVRKMLYKTRVPLLIFK